MKALRQIDVVGVRARATAQHLEVEPHQPAGALAVGDVAPVDVERGTLAADRYRLLCTESPAARLDLLVDVLDDVEAMLRFRLG